MVLGFETEGPVHAFQTFPTELYSQPWICFCKTGVELRAHACWVESTTVHPQPFWFSFTLDKSPLRTTVILVFRVCKVRH